MNRWLCVSSYAPAARPLRVRGESTCDDVTLMRAALEGLGSGAPIDCGSAGTVLRFMALRASREPGRHRLTGTRRLFERPQSALIKTLGALGVDAKAQPGSLVIESQGWRAPTGALEIDRSVSSQFISSLALNAWDLPFDLEVKSVGNSVSDAYFAMTLAVLRAAGMDIAPDGAFIPAGQRVNLAEARAESDMSSAFAVAALAAVSGAATMREFPSPSLQPDVAFVEILERMGVPVERSPGMVTVRRAELAGVECHLRDCPDLFPVLAALCALAKGPSRLYGAAHLVHKESDRIARMEPLLKLTGRDYRLRSDGLEIKAGAARSPDGTPEIHFDPVDDHRLVMAAAVLRHAGYKIQILNPGCVAKSYPEFLGVAGIAP